MTKRKDPVSGKALDVTTYRLVVNGKDRKKKFGNQAAAIAAFRRAVKAPQTMYAEVLSTSKRRGTFRLRSWVVQ